MRYEATIIFLIFTAGLVYAARPVSNLVDHIVTKLRSKREAGRIRLDGDDEGQTKKPFPHYGLVPVTILSFIGIAVQVLMIVINVRRHYWHRDTVLNWWFTQIAYFVLYIVLIIFALTYPSQYILTTTHTFPPALPIFNFKRSSSPTNPGSFIQTTAVILFMLPFIVSLAPYSWYNWFYYRNAGFGAPTLVSVAQQVVALAVFVYGTFVRQVYRDREESENMYAQVEEAASTTTEPAWPNAGSSA